MQTTNYKFSSRHVEHFLPVTGWKNCISLGAMLKLRLVALVFSNLFSFRTSFLNNFHLKKKGCRISIRVMNWLLTWVWLEFDLILTWLWLDFNLTRDLLWCDTFSDSARYLTLLDCWLGSIENVNREKTLVSNYWPPPPPSPSFNSQDDILYKHPLSTIHTQQNVFQRA